MALILALETSSQNCSVALFEGDKILSEEKNTETFRHSQVLFPLIKKILHSAEATIKDVNAIALSSGPGSFTGLRIGTAAALGMCHAMNIPLITINTLEGMIDKAKKNVNEKKLFCPMIDARRMEVYCMIKNFDDEIILPQQAKIIDENSFDEYNEDILCFGDGAEKCKKVFSNNKKIKFLDGIEAEAVNMCSLANERFLQRKFDDILTYEPNYLK